MFCKAIREASSGFKAACAVVAFVGLAAAPTLAAPSLRAEGEQRLKPAALRLSPIQLWDTEWWLLIDARPDGAALSRLEYRTRFTDERPQSKAGGIELDDSTVEALGGRVAIKLPTRDDYTRPLEARLRVTDAGGNSSEWVVVEFPPGKSIRPSNPSDYTVAAQADADRKHRVVGIVEYEASDSTLLRVVRNELGRRARAAGGDAAVGVRMVRSTDESFVFEADVIRYLEVARPTPTAVSLATDRELGEIVVSYERR